MAYLRRYSELVRLCRRQLKSATNSGCATLQSDKSVKLTRCASPAPAEQTWKYSKSSQQLTSKGGMCVTASSPTSHIKQVTTIIGRPLANASYALLFL